jgi:hypothetical protein
MKFLFSSILLIYIAHVFKNKYQAHCSQMQDIDKKFYYKYDDALPETTRK